MFSLTPASKPSRSTDSKKRISLKGHSWRMSLLRSIRRSRNILGRSQKTAYRKSSYSPSPCKKRPSHNQRPHIGGNRNQPSKYRGCINKVSRCLKRMRRPLQLSDPLEQLLRDLELLLLDNEPLKTCENCLPRVGRSQR